MVGISKDSQESHRKFRDKYGLRVTLLSDPDTSVMSAWDAWRLRRKNGGDAMGPVRCTYLVDPEGRVRGAWPEVGSVKGHADEVLATLERLGSASG